MLPKDRDNIESSNLNSWEGVCVPQVGTCSRNADQSEELWITSWSVSHHSVNTERTNHNISRRRADDTTPELSAKDDHTTCTKCGHIDHIID